MCQTRNRRPALSFITSKKGGGILTSAKREMALSDYNSVKQIIILSDFLRIFCVTLLFFLFFLKMSLEPFYLDELSPKGTQWKAGARAVVTTDIRMAAQKEWLSNHFLSLSNMHDIYR